jgi:hypothetical protein
LPRERGALEASGEGAAAAGSAGTQRNRTKSHALGHAPGGRSPKRIGARERARAQPRPAPAARRRAWFMDPAGTDHCVGLRVEHVEKP